MPDLHVAVESDVFIFLMFLLSVWGKGSSALAKLNPGIIGVNMPLHACMNTGAQIEYGPCFEVNVMHRFMFLSVSRLPVCHCNRWPVSQYNVLVEIGTCRATQTNLSFNFGDGESFLNYIHVFT